MPTDLLSDALQPPFLTSMIMAVYRAEKAAGHEDRAWLRGAISSRAKTTRCGIANHTWRATPAVAVLRLWEWSGSRESEGRNRLLPEGCRYFLLHWEGRNYVADMSGGKSETPSPERSIPCECAMSRKRWQSPSVRIQEHLSDRGLLQGRPRDARVGFDISFRFGPYGGVHASLCACLSE